MKTQRKNKNRKTKKVGNRLLEGFRIILPKVKSEHYLKYMSLKYSGFELFHILDAEGKAGAYTDFLVVPTYLDDPEEFLRKNQSSFDFRLTIAISELLMYVEQLENLMTMETKKLYIDRRGQNVQISFKDITYTCVKCHKECNRVVNNVCLSCYEKNHCEKVN